MNETISPDLELLAERVRLCKKTVADYKRGHSLGHLSYDDLAAAGKELSEALFEYSCAKFPSVKPRKIPYQAIIR